MSFWQAYRYAAREAGTGVLMALPFGVLFVLTSWLAWRHWYVAITALWVVVVLLGLAIAARVLQRTSRCGP